MNSKERFDFMSTKLPGVYNNTAENIIERHVNTLIDALYIPMKGERCTSTDKNRLDFFGIDNEPINWGDLSCREVEAFKNGSYLVTIEEASPGSCPTFCNYIEEYLKSYGWEVQVQTEW